MGLSTTTGPISVPASKSADRTQGHSSLWKLISRRPTLEGDPQFRCHLFAGNLERRNTRQDQIGVDLDGRRFGGGVVGWLVGSRARHDPSGKQDAAAHDERYECGSPTAHLAITIRCYRQGYPLTT